MGVAEDQLFADAVGHVVQVEPAGVLLNGGVEEDLEQDVAQLLLQVVGIALVDGLGHLVGLLDEVAPDALVGLFPVPGAAPGMAQPGHQQAQVLYGIPLFAFKYSHNLSYHSQRLKSFRHFFSPWAKFSGFFLDFHRIRSSLAILSPLGIRDRSSRETMRRASTSTA